MPTLKLREWSTTYGRTYAFYEGAHPVMVTHDVAILHDVFVRQFAKFHGRRVSRAPRVADMKMPLIANHADTDPKGSVFNTRGLRWKRLRALTAPAMSRANLQLVRPPRQSALLSCCRW